MSHSNIALINQPLTFSQKILFKLLSKITFGQITVLDKNTTYTFTGEKGFETHNVKIIINNMDVYNQLLFNGSLGAGKSYMLGYWDTDDLNKLLEIFIINSNLFTEIEGTLARCANVLKILLLTLTPQNISRAKKNILRHYDLGNEFFELFLDPTKMYSCAVFKNETMTLEAASYNKLEIICNLLELKPTDHILEIGSGWGGFAIYAAQKYHCKVTTTTISDKQYNYVKNQIQKLGLQDNITLLNLDYRQLSGQYDKLVSIEMIEAVGHKYFNIFFRKCNQLLKSGGLFLLQGIVINDQSFEQVKNKINFINKYIFPGGCLPSICSISKSIASQTDMQLLHLNDIGEHYVATLHSWLNNFIKNISQVRALNFNDQFIRMWRYYLSACAATFKTLRTSAIHAVWRKR